MVRQTVAEPSAYRCRREAPQCESPSNRLGREPRLGDHACPPARRRGAELLFQVLTEREEKNSLAIASNEAFGGWVKTFTDPCLCAAIVDSLTFGGTIFETGTDSYRLAQTRARNHVGS